MGFFKTVASFFKHMFTSSNWTHVAMTTLTLTAPTVETLVSIFGGAPAGNAVTVIMNKVMSGFGVVNTILAHSKDGQLSSSELVLVSSTLNAIKDNLSQIESVAEIKDPTTVTKVNLAVTAIVNEVDAIISILPSQTPVTNTIPTIPAQATTPAVVAGVESVK